MVDRHVITSEMESYNVSAETSLFRSPSKVHGSRRGNGFCFCVAETYIQVDADEKVKFLFLSNFCCLLKVNDYVRTQTNASCLSAV